MYIIKPITISSYKLIEVITNKEFSLMGIIYTTSSKSSRNWRLLDTSSSTYGA